MNHHKDPPFFARFRVCIINYKYLVFEHWKCGRYWIPELHIVTLNHINCLDMERHPRGSFVTNFADPAGEQLAMNLPAASDYMPPRSVVRITSSTDLRIHSANEDTVRNHYAGSVGVHRCDNADLVPVMDLRPVPLKLPKELHQVLDICAAQQLAWTMRRRCTVKKSANTCDAAMPERLLLSGRGFRIFSDFLCSLSHRLQNDWQELQPAGYYVA